MAIGGGEASRVAGGGDTTVMGSLSWKETNPFLYKVIESVFVTAIGGITGAGFGGIVGMATASKSRRCSLVSQGLKGQPVHALSCAAGIAVVAGIFYKVRETIKSRINQELFYTELRVMLLKLGLEEYEKNFKKGHLTDPTLSLLTDSESSELKEVNIPPGARLLILDHVKRYPKVKSKRGKQ